MKTRASMVCPGLAVVFVATGSGVLAQNLVVLPTGPDQDTEPSIAVSTLDPCEAVSVWFTSDNTENAVGWYATTRDGWDTVHVGDFNLAGPDGPVDFSVGHDTVNDVFWVAYFARGGLAYAKSFIDPNDNISFEGTEVILDPGFPQLGFTDKPWLTAGRRPTAIPDTNLYIAYTGTAEDDPAFGLRFKRSVRLISDPNCPEPDSVNQRCWEPTQLLGPLGDGGIPVVSPSRPEIIYVVYWVDTADNENEDERIEIIKSINTGQQFAPPQLVANLVNQDFGPGWMTPCVAGQAKRIVKFPSMVAKKLTFIQEKLYVVWAEANLGDYDCLDENRACACVQDGCGGERRADVDIFFMRFSSSLSGSTITPDFNEPQVLPLDPGGVGAYTCADQFFPWLTIDGNNTLHLVYFDNRNTLDQDDPPLLCPNSTANQRDDDSCAMTFDLYYTFSTNDGVDWAPPERITTVAEGGSSFLRDANPNNRYFIGDYIGVSASLDPQQPAINVAFNRNLDAGGDRSQLEVYAGRIEPSDCP